MCFAADREMIPPHAISDTTPEHDIDISTLAQHKHG